jgi:hypothetical protein
MVSYNASAVKFFNATRFESKNIFFYYEKRSSPLQRWRCGCIFLIRRIGSWLGDSNPRSTYPSAVTMTIFFTLSPFFFQSRTKVFRRFFRLLLAKNVLNEDEGTLVRLLFTLQKIFFNNSAKLRMNLKTPKI